MSGYWMVKTCPVVEWSRCPAPFIVLYMKQGWLSVESIGWIPYNISSNGLTTLWFFLASILDFDDEVAPEIEDFDDQDQEQQQAQEQDPEEGVAAGEKSDQDRSEILDETLVTSNLRESRHQSSLVGDLNANNATSLSGAG